MSERAPRGVDARLAARVRAWAADDPDPGTATELTLLLAAAQAGDGAAAADLADRFAGTLTFGTAGLRGRLGAGPNRMNRAVVLRAAAGLAAFLTDALGPAAGPRVVVGYDARHGSAQFARDTAAVVTAAGGDALLLPEPLPTPVLAFAVRHLGADAGVMVTASHNPAPDNGYKVYLGGRAETGAGQGALVVPPADGRIAARIDAAGPASAIPRAPAGWRVLGADVLDAYVARAAAGASPGAGPGPRIVLTPLHGVGGAVAVRALAAAGFTDVHVVEEQAEPDPDFPTVAYPNPEEPGALDLALARGRELAADLVLATDPDADRCAAAVPEGAGWRVLTGDEVGSLLGLRAARAAVAAGARGAVLASSIVSSRLLARIAAAHGLAHRTTLTGFKWIARVPGLVYGYEEALGYCTDPAAVRDKDGISAAVRLAALVAERRAAGSGLAEALDELAVAHGLHATGALGARFDDVAGLGAATALLRRRPPAVLGGSPVVEATDLALGSTDLPPTDGLLYVTAAGDRAVVRPSGTEPKVKCYLEVVVPVAGRDVAGARAAAAARLAALGRDVAAAAGLPLPAGPDDLPPGA
jgi:phosphomannomutase